MENLSHSLPLDPKFEAGLSAKQILLFWKKVKKGVSENDCWEWNAALDNRGYGKFQNNLRSHRISYYLHNGFIPKFDKNTKSIIMHKCDNPKCVNPNHLTLGSLADNMLDAKIKGRTPRFGFTGPQLHPDRMPRGEKHWSKRLPEKWKEMNQKRLLAVKEWSRKCSENPKYVHPNSKLKPDQILEIKFRRKCGESVISISNTFKVARSLIYSIINNKRNYGKYDKLQLADGGV